MKTIISIVSLGLGLIIPGISSEREVFNAGKKQELLSSTAAYALEAEDVQLLDALKKAGWDPSKKLGQMPDQDLYLNYTPLTFSTLVGAQGGVRWLLESCGLSPDSRDGNLDRPIDVLLRDANRTNDAFSPTEDEINKLLPLLERKSQPKEEQAIEETCVSVVGKFGSAHYTLQSVNGAPAPDLWRQYGKDLEKIYALEERSQEDVGEERKQPKNVTLKVRWDKVAVDEYRFSVSSGDNGWGGGVSGVIYHKYGYWLTKGIKYWDS